MTATEATLDALEHAWADWAYSTRADAEGTLINGDARVDRRRPGDFEMHTEPLATVAARLSDLRKRYESGEVAAAWYALQLCVWANVPLAHWLRTALMAVFQETTQRPTAVHAAFGLDHVLPTSPKRGLRVRRDREQAAAIYGAVSSLLVKDKHRDQGTNAMSVEEALVIACTSLNLAVSPRKAWSLYRQGQSAASRSRKSPR